MTDMTDPRQVYVRAITQTEPIVAAVQPSQLGLPTPCAEYDVRALLSHIGGMNGVATAGETGDALAAVARVDGVPDHGWLAAYQAASARAQAAWADDAKLDAEVKLPWARCPGVSRSPATCRNCSPTPGTWPRPPASRPKVTPELASPPRVTSPR